MPQLIPDPWFFILLISWLIIISFPAQKILKCSISNDPTTNMSKYNYNNWTWPWL
uniref:ATP synthase complex subunit 8 n=1 Tax=Otophryne sp. AMNH 101748 TaxID=2877825 RepID=A0A8K1LZR3_9NEOB|nr:ATP synthase F0 subunit 8 [Otophryne sp. AMNH 101748]